MKTIAIIGTAGRDKSKPMTRALWNWMLADATSRLTGAFHLVSGGAAWADHLAVALFLSGRAPELTLHLPAPFEQGRFIGPRVSAGNASNYYHGKFSQAINELSLEQLQQAIARGAHVTYEPAAQGYGAMFTRNGKVAQAEGMLAYTFGTGDVPADGGTSYTWDHCTGRRLHVSLPHLESLGSEDVFDLS